ncbi:MULTISPECIES: hypothetical protein [unclassified Novosphingobium]|uniref:hypothetical protein n=1 Tax=unclassified Novosphingobium TaxID=2644732 RepID=UPI001448A132|nr:MULTISPECIES: hypothetical protein [unclassified Novosphingobium]NKJ45097.1 hypothetical protein [Novosphingobium sp. SG720]NMN06792.1 hypothetical protein [Novosphingobium sp. SG919]NMN88757.1 hypothetical protein [Novosphingobium sp. SG916]
MLVQASEAVRLSGLTAHQLREWCGRRALVEADVPPAGRGHLALFSWQTILALRVLNEVHLRYAVEVSGWREAIAQLQALLRKRAFPSLWGHTAIFANAREASLRVSSDPIRNFSCLVVELDAHLEILATPNDLRVESQLQLFPAMAVR